jgi:RHS repeat-associated protein
LAPRPAFTRLRYPIQQRIAVARDDRLTLVTSGTLTTTFEYDGLGNRMAQTVDGVETRYALDVAGGLPEVIVATVGGASTRYVQVQGQILAEYEAGAWGYVLPDALGSVRQVVDAAGQVSLAQSYDPFGVPFETFGSGKSDFGYTGEWYESYTQLLYLRARWYIPGTGTFLSKDLADGNEQQPITLHQYGYARNNPVSYSDPTGFQAQPNGHDPYDPAWCDSWWYPKKASCQFITNRRVPEPLRWAEMDFNYMLIMAAQEAFGYRIGGRLWRNFLSSGGDLSIQRSDLKDWFREDANFNLWHNQQMNDFLGAAVMPAIEESCGKQITVEWKARRHKPETGTPEAVGLFRDIGHYAVIPISALRASEVSFTLGKYFLEGDFKAENIRSDGSFLTADITINRFVDDRFDFRNDFGGIPMHRLFPGFPNPGFGDVPNVWAQTLVENGLASYFNIHMEWVEKTTEVWVQIGDHLGRMMQHVD